MVLTFSQFLMETRERKYPIEHRIDYHKVQSSLAGSRAKRNSDRVEKWRSDVYKKVFQDKADKALHKKKRHDQAIAAAERVKSGKTKRAEKVKDNWETAFSKSIGMKPETKKNSTPTVQPKKNSTPTVQPKKKSLWARIRGK